MKNSKRYQCGNFRIKASHNLCGNRGIWLDLWGNSTDCLALTTNELERISSKFEEAAQWLRKEGKAYLSKKKNTK